MSDIEKTTEALPLPSRDDLKTMCFSLSRDEIWESLKDWESHGNDGAHRVSQAASVMATKEALEERHPYREKDKPVKTYEKLQKEYVFLMDHEEEAGFFGNQKTRPFRSKLQGGIAACIKKWYPLFLTSALREETVKQHARGNSTANVMRYLLSPACEVRTPFYYLNDKQGFLGKYIVEWLLPRLSYLKLGASAFPQKYRELWHAERTAYLEEIKGIPLTETSEQVKALYELYSRLDDAFNKSLTEKGKAQISSSMVKVMSGLYTLTRDPSLKQPALKEKTDD